MPKQLVTVIGLVVSLGVIALGVFIVALPLYFQAVSVDDQTQNVSDTNAIYQAQVDSLRAEEENLAEIDAAVAELRAQLPATGQLDDVFEVVARAAEASGVALSSVAAGERVVFVARTGVVDLDSPATEPVPEPEPTAEATQDEVDPETDDTTQGADVATPDTAGGRQQVDFVIQATATDMAQAVAFLDALRAGPRLLSSITATTSLSGEAAFDVRVSALTYVDAEG